MLGMRCSALAASLLSVSSPTIGAALILIALLSVLSDALLGVSPGRRMTQERASQNVVVPAKPALTAIGRGSETAATAGNAMPVRLIRPPITTPGAWVSRTGIGHDGQQLGCAP